MSKGDELISLRQASRLCGRSVSALHVAIQDGRLGLAGEVPSAGRHGKAYRVWRDEVLMLYPPPAPGLDERVAALEREVAELRRALVRYLGREED